MLAAHPLRISVVILLAWSCGTCAHLTRQRQNPAGTLTVAFILDTGVQRGFGPVPLHPAPRPVPNARELPYDGGSGMTAVWLKPTPGNTQLFVLKEGPGGPGTAVSVTPMQVGFPTDGVVRYPEIAAGVPAQSPCVSVTGFFVDGIGAPPPGPVMLWLREGSLETSFSIRPDSSIRMRPALTVDTAKDDILASRKGGYSLVIEKSAEARDVMIVAIATKPDGSLWTHYVTAALRRTGTSELHGSDENWTWRFYALDDRRELHTHCRSIDTKVPVRDARYEFLWNISQQYPGFRPLYPHEFDTRVQPHFESDTRGPVVAGHFNYDAYRDFAAVVVPADPPVPRATHSRADSQDFVEGKRITCFGTALRDTFQCDAEQVTVTRPRQEEFLIRIPPGRHQCMRASQRPRTMTTTIDSVGVVHGDGTSDFVVRRQDGSMTRCALTAPGEKHE